MAHPVISTRNRNQWQQIALFLDAMPKRKPAAIRAAKAPAPAGGKRSAAAGVVA